MNDILIGGTEIEVRVEGPYKGFIGKIVKVLQGQSTPPRYKVRFDMNKGSYRDTYYRWFDESDLIPTKDPAYKMLFGD